MQHKIFFNLFNKRLFFLVTSFLLIFLSILVPPNVPMFSLLASLNIKEIYNMYLQSDTFFRMPDTFNRVSIFVLSLVFLVMSSLYNPPLKSHNRLITISFIALSSLFFTTIIITNNIYNLSIMFLIIISIYYYIYKGKAFFKRVKG